MAIEEVIFKKFRQYKFIYYEKVTFLGHKILKCLKSSFMAVVICM